MPPTASPITAEARAELLEAKYLHATRKLQALEETIKGLDAKLAEQDRELRTHNDEMMAMIPAFGSVAEIERQQEIWTKCDHPTVKLGYVRVSREIRGAEDDCCTDGGRSEEEEAIVGAEES